MIAAERYWHRTLYAIEGVSGDKPSGPQPPPAKLYPGALRRRLAGSLPLTLGDVRRAFGGGDGEGSAVRPFDAGALSALLHYVYGTSRVEPSRQGLVLHRMVPSARCCYSAELYVWLPDAFGADAGLHYYDPAHHSLIALRPQADAAPVAAALAADLDGARCVLFVTSRFWKIAYRYGAYAYRLCTQEAGILVGNALAVAAAMGLDGHLHHRFVDVALHRWLGLRADEETLLGVVPLYRRRAGTRRGIRRPAPATGLPAADADPTPPSVATACDRRECAEFLDLDAGSWIRDAAGIVAPPRAGFVRLPRSEEVSLPPETETATADLAAALRLRSSGLPCFNPTGERLPAAAFELLCRYATVPHVSDVASAGHLPVGLILAVHRVEGIADGVYRAGPGGRVEALRRGSPAADLAATSSHPFTVNFETANVVAAVVGDPELACGGLGDRGYRILNVEAGIVAQRVCLLGAAAGLFARPYNTYDARASSRVLGLEATGAVPIFQIALGRPRPADRWRTPPLS